MASPIFKFPEILKNLYEGGHKEFSVEVVTKEIKMVTGFYKNYTVREIIRTMEELGFIKKSKNGFTIISFDGRKLLPEVEKRIEKEANKEIDSLEADL